MVTFVAFCTVNLKISQIFNVRLWVNEENIKWICLFISVGKLW